MGPDSASLQAAILNAAWMVRHYARGGRMSESAPLRAKRADAIRQLGIVVRDAFNRTENFEPLLIALYNGLAPKDDPPF